MDTGYHSNHTHYSRAMSLPANRTRRGSLGSPRRQHRQRRIRSSSHSTSPNDASDEELDDRPLSHSSHNRAYSSADALSSEQDDDRSRKYHHQHSLTKQSPVNKHRDFLKQIESTFLQEDVNSDNSPMYNPVANGRDMQAANGDMRRSPRMDSASRRSPSSETKSSSLQIKSLEEVTDMFNQDPQELHRVVLYKDSDVEDFGFSVSDGVYDKGVYVNTVRPGGPGARNGNIRPFDRILQVRIYSRRGKI